MKKRRTFIVALVSFGISTALMVCGTFTYLENKTYDSRTAICKPSSTASDNICFIMVDQESIDWAQKEKGWGWPWPRAAYGDMVRYLTAGNADSILFDIMFTEPSVYGEGDDESFAHACSDSGRVVQTMFVSGSGEDTSVLFPIDSLTSSARLIANITSAKDSDDVIRRARLSFLYEGNEYPSLGSAPYVMSFAKSTGGNSDNANVSTKCSTPSTREALDSLKHTIPLQNDGTVLLRYRQAIADYIPYRASYILQSYDDIKAGKEPLIPPENFAGTAVYVAYYAPGLFDICSTSVSQVYPGVGVHITTYDNIMSNNFVRQVPLWLNVFCLLIVSFAGAYILGVAGLVKSERKKYFLLITGIVLSLLTIIGIPFILFSHSIWLFLVAPLFCFALSFIAELFLSYAMEGKQKKFIKNAFSQYLSPKVIDQIIIDPKKLKLGGEKRCISIYFSDVQGFTSISENLTPEKLTEVLNSYLSEMTDIILASGGTIDKYEGDALIAFWNAPADEADHARRCLEAAMNCQKKLAELRPKLASLSGGQLYQRIGMNTGYAVVGNMGSHSRFDYTMLGDSVNLASRLEGLNKQFGTYTMCSQATKDEAVKFGSTLCWRELAKVAVVGKKEAVTVFEPMEQDVFEAKKETIAVFEKGRDLFYNGDFMHALELFESQAVNDPPCSKYAEKCRSLIATPPQNWDGVWHSTEK